MARHLAIFDKQSADLIFSGKRKIEGRFSQIKIPPFLKVAVGDVVLVKIPGEKIVGQFSVDRVFYFDHPRKLEIESIKKKYTRELALSNSFWFDHEKINFATLIFIGTVTRFLLPPQIPKKDLRPWVVLET